TRPAALDYLLEPRIIGHIRESVRDLEPEIHSHESPERRAVRATKQRNRREGSNDQEKAVHTVVMSVMYSGVTADHLPTEEDRTKHWNVMEEEPKTGGEPRARENEEPD